VGAAAIGPSNASLALAAALLVSSVGALAQSCTVAQGAILAFPPVVALANGGDQTTDSGQSFKISCDASVVTSLRLYAASPRVMINNSRYLPFNLSLTSGALSNDLAASSPGTPLNITRDGQGQTVPLYARIYAHDFQSLPGGVYATTLTLTLEY
jgi:spore coat protein U-like protein